MIDLFAPLTAGAVLYILPESIRKDAVAVGKFIKEEKITTATFPTQMGELVAELLDDAPSLKFVTLGGEKFKYYQMCIRDRYLHLRFHGKTKRCYDRAYQPCQFCKS